MTYEIGQKVETPFGKGVVTFLSNIGVDEIDSVWVSFKNVPEIEFSINVIKPYKTPHEKLLDMGFEFEEVLGWSGNPFSHNWRKGDQRITIYLYDKTVTTYEVCKEAIAVLTQYLEWLEEEK